MFAALYENAMRQETPHKGLLLRGDASDLQQGETLLLAAIHEGKNSACPESLLACLWWLKDK